MKIISATVYLSKNAPFNTDCPACLSKLEVVPNDIFVDTEINAYNEEIISPKYTCPVCFTMVIMTAPVIPRRVLEIWREQQPV